MRPESTGRPASPANRWQRIAPLVIALVVVGLVDLVVRLLGGQLAGGARPAGSLTQGAVRYAGIVATRLAEVVLVLAALAALFRGGRAGSLAQVGLAGRRWGWLPAGIGLTLLALGLALALAAVTGILRPERVQFPGPWPMALAFTAAAHAAVLEEIIFRGLLMQIVERLWTRWGAILASAALFAALHVFAPFRLSASWWVLVVAAGVGLGWIFYANHRNLWLPMGLHLGFNFGVFALFGLPGETRGALLWPGLPAAPALSPQAGWVLLLGLAFTAATLLLAFRPRKGPAT